MTASFGKLRAFFWPIHRVELKKFIPLFFIYFLITFNYNLLRIFKDSLLVTAPNSGAEALPFVKVWAVLPMAILFTMFFTWLSNRVSREKVFYVMISIFISFFLIFVTFLYPCRDLLHPHALANSLEAILPSGFKGLIVLLRNWTFTLCYVMSDLWSSVILSVLFWGFANEVTKIDEAKRFYGVLMIGSNFSGVLSGQASVLFSKIPFIAGISYGTNSWDQCVFFMNFLVILVGCVTIFLFRRLNQRVIRKETPLTTDDKPKMSFREQIAYLAKSKYLCCIAFIVLSYNLVMNLVEVVWKNQMKQLYPDPTVYNTYMGEVLTATSVIATLTALLVTSNVIRRYSWTVAALIPAVITFVTGVFFFFFALFSKNIPLLGLSPLFLCVTFGSMQNCFARASKYTLFDATTNLAFIPLESDVKLKGKAAIDGIGSRLGKSGGSVIHQGFLLLFTTISASMPYIGVIFLVAVGIWIFSVKSLGKKFNQLTESPVSA